MRTLPCIGMSKIYDIDNHLEAAQDAIGNYLKEKDYGIFSMSIIIKSYEYLNFSRVNEIFELIQGKFNCEEICCNMKEVKDEILKDKIEIILIGE